MTPSFPVRQKASAVLVALLVFALGACASSAPPLPVDTTAVNRQSESKLSDFSSEDAALSCGSIQAERQQNEANIAVANKAIEGNRKQNQVAGYFGALFLVPFVATEGNYAEKDAIEKLNKRQDVLLKLAVLKRCP